VCDIIEKTRELFKFKNYSAKLEVDNYPFVGLFLEIEGERKEVIEIMTILGFSMDDAIKKHNGEIFDDYVKANPQLKFKNYKLQYTFEDEERILCPEDIILVDEDDNIIGSTRRTKNGDEGRFRVSNIWITNSKNEILIAKRAWWKYHHSLKWGTAAGGANAVGESYESNIIKETKEEIGIDLKEIELFTKLTTSKYFQTIFKTKMDINLDDCKLNHEVDEIKWISKENLRKEIQENPENFVSSIKKIIKFTE